MSENTNNNEIPNTALNQNSIISESIIEKINIYENKEISMINESFEQTISEILSFLIDAGNLVIYKIKIVKFLQNLIIKIEVNSEIISRNEFLQNNGISIYKIIIHEYIIYKNNSNNLDDEISYRRELLVLFDILITQITFDRESYHYILSFLTHYLNSKIGNIDSFSEFSLNSEALNRLLTLIQKYYHPFDTSKFYGNYFFFNGDSENSIKIKNKVGKDNKKILNFEDKLNILFYIKVFSSENIKSTNEKRKYTIMKLVLNDKDKESEISIDIDVNNNLSINIFNSLIGKLIENETNSILIKLKKKKKLEIKLYLNGKKLFENKTLEKEKTEIKEIILFENFIGICYNILIFKNRCPKFILNDLNCESKDNVNNKKDNTNKNNINKKPYYYNGFNGEELLLPFLKIETKEDNEQNNIKLTSSQNVSLYSITSNDLKEFKEKIVSLYIPSRVSIPIAYEKNNLMNTPLLIIEDSINELNAEFKTKFPTMNGVHIYKRIKDDFNQIGGLNNLLPIMELMVNNKELLTKENIEKFFDILISIFSPHYKNALINEANNNFFLYLSYFMEKIPPNYYDNNITIIFKKISSFFTENICEENYIINQQYQNYILMNEQILFKFHYKEQNEIIESMSHFLQHIKLGKKKHLSIDIFKIIKILLHLDKNKNIVFCCKNHADYFIENKRIMEPELHVRLSPIKELLKHLFQEYKKYVRENNELRNEAGSSLFKIFTMLVSDISPCLQKMILQLFYESLEINFDLYIDDLDQNDEILNICLFAFKNSIFDVKEDALNLIFLILKQKPTNSSLEEIYQFINNSILPYFLYQDEEIIKNTVEESNIEMKYTEQENDKKEEKIKQENNKEENIDNDQENVKKEKSEEKKENMNTQKVENDLFNEMYSDTDSGEPKNQLNSVKEINGVKYSLPIFNNNLEKIYSLYNKKRLKILLYNLYQIVNKKFYEGLHLKLCINLLIKLVSKGDLFMISSFLEALNTENFENSLTNKNILEEELKNNQTLLQWLIETNFHLHLIKESKMNKQLFVPGFDIDNKIENGNEIIINETEKKEKINQNISSIEKILKYILLQNVYLLDYIFTWSKYYYELRNQTNNFKSVRELIFSFLPEIVFQFLNDMTNLEKADFSVKKMSIYSFNLFFEFVTYYKLKQEDLEIYKDEKSIFQELSTNFKYIFVTKMEENRNTLRQIYFQEPIDSKFEEYLVFKIAFDKMTPLWKGVNKTERQENEIYNQYIKNKKDINIKELEMMFCNFKDSEITDHKNKNIYVNKGIPLIFIFYHFFTVIFSIGGTEDELKEIFTDFRLFIILIIISSSTLTSQGLGKKKKWPTEEEYKEVQKNIEYMFYNLIYFFINKIKNTKENINEYNERLQDLDSNEKKYLDYLSKIYNLFIKNFGFILKILNNIYKEKKKEDQNNKGFTYFIKGIKSVFVDSDEVKKSGVFKLMEKLYLECESLLNDSENENILDKITKLEINNFFILNKDEKAKKIDEVNLLRQLEMNISLLLDATEFLNFFERHSEENKKVLFPFVSYISARRDAIKNIIPIYDIRPNISSYPKNYVLSPDYIPESPYDLNLITSINPVNIQLNKSINLDLKTCELEMQYKSHHYKKEKERLFSFRGIWSTNEFFYQKEKYQLKYRMINHLSEDFTRILLTPIIDIDYYLPKFSQFDEKTLFRKISSYIQINKVTDLSFDIKKLPPLIDSTKKITNHSSTPGKEIISQEQSIKNEDKAENVCLHNEDKDEGMTSKKEEDRNVLYYIGKELLSCIKEEKQKDIHGYLFYEYIHKKHSIDSTGCLAINACLVRIGFHIRGYIFNNSKGIGFYSFESLRNEYEEDDGYDADRKVCFGSVFRSQNHKYNNFYIWIPYDKIQMFFKRRYFFKRQAIEIFTDDRKSYLFKLQYEKIQFFIENIKSYMKQDIEEISIAFNKFDEKIGFVNKNNIFLNANMNFIANEKRFMNLKRIYEKWSKWEISTLKLLMILNIYGNRTYNDINQYHVFPWIIMDYVSESIPVKDNFIRPFDKPMGMLDFTEESKERKENYEMHWSENEKDSDRDENYDRYGSHYSTSLYLTYYLVRVFPFSYIRIELQGKKFDDPNRLFNSLPTSFENAISQKSDLRELIPEFFCFPEMFLNMNELNLGEISDSNGKRILVQEVSMPLWAKNNAYNFIEKHRELLESSEINETINEWFNIIFGSKQNGKEGKKIKNLFIKQTYEEFDETYMKGSKTEKIYQCRMVEFGVTPNQIFKNDTYKRQNLNDNHKIKRSLLFNIFQKMKKKQAITGNELILEENKVNSKENIKKFFVFLISKKDTKKERLFLLSKNKVEVYTKDKPQVIKSEQKENSKDENKEKEENNEDINIGDALEESKIKKDQEKIEEKLTSSNKQNQEKISEMENKNQGKGKNKSLRFKNDKKFIIPKYRMNFADSSTLLYNEGNIIVFGGFWNGDIIIEPIDESQKVKVKNINIIKTKELSPITKIIIDKTGTFSICVNLEGTIFVYVINPKEKSLWNFHKKINEGQGEVTSIQINENLGIFIICFKNGYNMVYTLPNVKLINSFRVEEKELNKNFNEMNNDNNKNTKDNNTNNHYNNIYTPYMVFISNSPLPCFIFYIKERKSLCVYSINAHFLNEYNLGYEIVKNGIMKYTDYSYRDFLLIFNPINYTIDIHKLTDLKLIISSPRIEYQFIDFHLSSEFDSLYILANDKKGGNKILIMKQSKIINQ